MNRFDRLFGILLHLRKGRRISAAELAAEFGVSSLTIYRDVETLSILGIPVYAERGREGGLRLMEGYFLPPIMFTREEIASLVVALTLFRSLRAHPFPRPLAAAEAKLLAAIPDGLREIMAQAPRMVGFEQTAPDIFHPEPPLPPRRPDSYSVPSLEERQSEVVTAFLKALLEQNSVRIEYRSPYSRAGKDYSAVPLGLYWDRGHWYLVGQPVDGGKSDQKLWRIDRVLDLRITTRRDQHPTDFDVRDLLDRRWLDQAMPGWIGDAPVVIRVTAEQAKRLQQDWYYRYARFEEQPGGDVLMTIADSEPEGPLELLRWLGPGAELIEPQAWRALAREQIETMLAVY